MEAETSKHAEYSRRDVVIIVAIVVLGAIVIGNFTTSTTAVQSVSSGPLTISMNATCTGFGPPTYWNSLDPDDNFTTYRYGFCLFGFWVSNGHPIGSGLSATGSGTPIDYGP